jgi:hypothetical protein
MRQARAGADRHEARSASSMAAGGGSGPVSKVTLHAIITALREARGALRIGMLAAGLLQRHFATPCSDNCLFQRLG